MRFLTLVLVLFLLGTVKTFAQSETGKASYYHDKFEGHHTSSGENFHQKAYTCAHKTHKFGTWLKVTNLKNDSVVFVRVNDRLPKKSKRSIDLTRQAAEELNFIRSGLTQVKIEVVVKEEVPEKYLEKNESK